MFCKLFFINFSFFSIVIKPFIELWDYNKWLDYNAEETDIDEEQFAEHLSSYGL